MGHRSGDKESARFLVRWDRDRAFSLPMMDDAVQPTGYGVPTYGGTATASTACANDDRRLKAEYQV